MKRSKTALKTKQDSCRDLKKNNDNFEKYKLVKEEVVVGMQKLKSRKKCIKKLDIQEVKKDMHIIARIKRERLETYVL